MRPLQRLPNGKSYSTYKSYKNDLLKNYGKYCAYCEKKGSDLDVEHVEPKSKSPTKITDWDNLLLACPTCNRDFKKSFNASRVGYIFPDTDETFEMFHYFTDGRIEATTVPAGATLKLCGLARTEACNDRADVFLLALEARREIEAGTRQPQHVIPWIKTMGYWSVWMTVFHDIPAMIALLEDLAHFAGTRSPYRRPVTPPPLAIP